MNNISNSENVLSNNELVRSKYSKSSYLKFIVFSFIGVFVLFVPIQIGNVKSIPMDHLVNLIRKIPFADPYYGILITMFGSIYPFISKSWNKNKTEIFFSFVKLFSIPFIIMAYFGLGPADFHKPNMLLFSYNLLTQIALINSIGFIFLSFLVDYGLMSFAGIFMRCIMKPIWKTSGRSSLDAIASFVGSYSIALLMTSKVYKKGYYSKKEACIIATGFSTVSTTFMIVVAKMFGVMDKWNIYFFGTMIITFLVTAITVRLYPLRSKPNNGYMDKEVKEEPVYKGGNIFKLALNEAADTASHADNFFSSVIKNLKEGLMVSISVMPNFMSITFIGLLIVNYTPIFDVISYIFLPVTKLLGLGDEAYIVAKACSVTLVEMSCSSSIVMYASQFAKSVVAVVCVAEILYFAAPIPVMLAVGIPISIKDMMIIWVERIVLALLFAVPFAYFFLS
ncbi:YjiH family protein [Brachyspira murdochii]|uniref:Nucleoside recognition domain protein n=2 Tax=Brachyspira murdochii TaxID=84378 RepID=D5U3Z1_BRAM5|nr:YjiH family protein [Brachyspira murdochii]ADG70158.1 nucleoside recognition domain protein [Brachyspira murdochii DSM 12563]PPS21081.1 histidine transporter [Brachyspira murdochii]